MLRIILLPVYVIIRIMAVAINIIIRLSDWIFYVLGFLFLLATVLCYYMQIESGAGLRHMIIGSGIMFLIPQAAGLLAGVLEVTGDLIGNKVGFTK